MKNFLFVFVVILLDAMGIPGGCQSCFHRTDDPDRVTVSRDKVYFKAEGGRTFIQVNSNRDWIVRSFDDWLSVDPMSGN